MRKTCLDTIYELAKKDKKILFIGSDLGPGVLNDFKKNIPERFFMYGVSEQIRDNFSLKQFEGSFYKKI